MCMKSKRRRALVLSAASALGLVVGCGAQVPPPVSPTAEQAPERYERALQATGAKARKDREDERKAFQRVRHKPPPIVKSTPTTVPVNSRIHD